MCMLYAYVLIRQPLRSARKIANWGADSGTDMFCEKCTVLDIIGSATPRWIKANWGEKLLVYLCVSQYGSMTKYDQSWCNTIVMQKLVMVKYGSPFVLYPMISHDIPSKWAIFWESDGICCLRSLQSRNWQRHDLSEMLARRARGSPWMEHCFWTFLTCGFFTTYTRGMMVCRVCPWLWPALASGPWGPWLVDLVVWGHTSACGRAPSSPSCTTSPSAHFIPGLGSGRTECWGPRAKSRFRDSVDSVVKRRWLRHL